MEDLTDALLAHGEQFVYTSDEEDSAGGGIECPQITIQMLNRNPVIKDEIFESLKDFLIDYANIHTVTGDKVPLNKEVAESFTDEQLVNALNSDPYIQGTIFECLNYVTDCQDNEGPAMYYPSILTMDNIQDLNKVSCFREDQVIEDIPAKYAHLDSTFIEHIYRNPELRQVVSEMDAIDITPEFISDYKNTYNP
jgi:hypothetical protein